MNMGVPPWTALEDKAIDCTGAEDKGDLGVRTPATESSDPRTKP